MFVIYSTVVSHQKGKMKFFYLELFWWDSLVGSTLQPTREKRGKKQKNTLERKEKEYSLSLSLSLSGVSRDTLYSYVRYWKWGPAGVTILYNEDTFMPSSFVQCLDMITVRMCVRNTSYR